MAVNGLMCAAGGSDDDFPILASLPGPNPGKPMIFRPLRVLGFWVGESYFLLSIVVETVRDSFPRAIRGV